jgi:hypothetical protein
MIKVLKPSSGLLLTLIALAAWGLTEGPPTALNTREVEMYRQIAHGIFDKIVALKDRYPHLAAINAAVVKDEAKGNDKLWTAYHYTHGMSWIQNPNYDPRKKCSRMLKSFSPNDGIELDLYFYEGEWMGQAMVRPTNIGDMKVVTLVEGSDTPSVAALRRDIARIVNQQKNEFKKHYSSANLESGIAEKIFSRIAPMLLFPNDPHAIDGNCGCCLN